VLSGSDKRDAIKHLGAVMSPEELALAQEVVLRVHASEALLDYLQALIAATRSGLWFVDGLSPRAGMVVLRAAKARALLDGRDYVAPDDLQSIFPPMRSPPPGAHRGWRAGARGNRCGRWCRLRLWFRGGVLVGCT
jgi:MoxR-like ATPase